MAKFIVEGGHALSGEVSISGSKNAALPIIAAALLTDEECTISNMPNIADVRLMIEIAVSLGASAHLKDGTLHISGKGLRNFEVEEGHAKLLRTSIMFLPTLLTRMGEAKIPFPGGCDIGKRPINAHLHSLESLGATVVRADDMIHLTSSGFSGAQLYVQAMSVTGTEIAVTAAVIAKGTTEIRLAAMEPHVQDLCHFLNSMGAKITGIGTPILTIVGVEKLGGTTYSVTPDYIETGTFVIAGLVTKGSITITNTEPGHLDMLWDFLNQMGAKYELGDTWIKIHPTKQLHALERTVRTGVYPDFPTDLLAPMAVLLTQTEGFNRVFETIYEARLNYVIELEKMGARCEILNKHEALIVGPTVLKGNPVASWDLRAGTAMVLAGLAAEGKTEISSVKYIDRGYEDLENKVRGLGGVIHRLEE